MEMPTIVGNFIFISRETFMLSWVQHEKTFYNLGVWLYIVKEWFTGVYTSVKFTNKKYSSLYSMSGPVPALLNWHDFYSIHILIGTEQYYESRAKGKCVRACVKCRDSNSSHACAKSHPGSPFIHSTLSKYSVFGQRRPWSDCAKVQANLGLSCPLMPETRFRMARPMLESHSSY